MSALGFHSVENAPNVMRSRSLRHPHLHKYKKKLPKRPKPPVKPVKSQTQRQMEEKIRQLEKQFLQVQTQISSLIPQTTTTSSVT